MPILTMAFSMAFFGTWRQVESMLGFTCSGGVATNKILAKLRSPEGRELNLWEIPSCV